MQVTPGEQTRDTITAVGRKTGYKKKNTLLIRKDNTVSFRGNPQREAQQPAISSPGCCGGPQGPRRCRSAGCIASMRRLTIPPFVVFQLLH